MTDTIEEIRARHEDTSGGWMHGYCDIQDGEQAHADRATLLRRDAQHLDEIARLSAELSEERARRVEWQPIETAPKDGTQILACQQFSEHLTAQGYVPDFSIVKWDDREKDFVAMADGYMSIKSQGDTWTIYHEPYVTHWQPLPTPPATHKDTQDE